MPRYKDLKKTPVFKFDFITGIQFFHSFGFEVNTGFQYFSVSVLILFLVLVL